MNYCWWFRNLPPPGMYKTLWITGYLSYQLVQDFFHQQYLHDSPWLSNGTWVCPKHAELPKSQGPKILDRSPVRHWNAEPRLAFGICFCSYGFPVAFLWVMVWKKSKVFVECWFFGRHQISQILYIKYKPDVGFIAVKTHPKFNQNVAPDSTFATACRQACSSTHLTPPKLQSKRSTSFGKCGGKFSKTSSFPGETPARRSNKKKRNSEFGA